MQRNINRIDNNVIEVPCGYGEGDCDGPGDGGGNDGHAGCQKGLVCGSNNCQQFGLYYHEKDDCCDVPDTLQTTTESKLIWVRQCSSRAQTR